MSARDDYPATAYGLWAEVAHIRRERYEAAMDELDALRASRSPGVTERPEPT